LFLDELKTPAVLRKLLPNKGMLGDSSPSQAATPSLSNITAQDEKEKLRVRPK